MKGLPRPLLIAHRGASAKAPESTAAAIRAGFRAGAPMVELDVQLTKDGRLVIFHDEQLERTTDGTGRLASMTYAALRRLDAGGWFAPRFRGERILQVSDVLRLLPASGWVNLELKRTSARRAVLTRLRRVLRASRRAARVLVSSFDAGLLRPLAGSRIPIALIDKRLPDWSLREAIRMRCAAWHPHHTIVSASRVARAHAAGLRVHAWTVDEPALARRMLAAGVDGLFSNDPARLRPLFKQAARRVVG